MPALLLFALLCASPLDMPPSGLSSAQAGPAQIVVQLPADAKLTFDGHLTKSADAQRWFITPPLEIGKTFHYTLKAECQRGAETVTVTKVIAVRAGRRTAVSFNVAGAAFWDEGSYATSLAGARAQETQSAYGVSNRRVAPLSAFTPNDNWIRAMWH
jgi:uncharacterized protein (TIGR03000 family)